MSILVVAGEPSGDAAAARVIPLLDADTFGMGGFAMAEAGAELLLRSDRTAALGLTEVWNKIPRLLRARGRLLEAVKTRNAKAALLVNYSEFNTSLLEPLAKSQTKTVFYGPPQVWAWRQDRAKKIAAHVGHVAAVLPLEVDVWQRAGAKVTYVGHPALDKTPATRAEALERVGRRRGALPLVAILPGSRIAEVRAHLGVMLTALRTLGLRGDEARVFIAGGLPAQAQRWIADTASAFDVSCIHVTEEQGLLSVLPAFEVAMVASGTAALEVALSGVVPIIGYRMSALSGAIARRLLRIPHVGLPNIVLGRGAFPELLQERFTAKNLASQLAAVLDGATRHPYRADLEELAATLTVKNRPSAAVAALVSER